MKAVGLFEGQRITLDESLEMTAASLREYGQRYRRWSLAFSGGKDSTALVTAVCHLISTGRVPAPEEITVLYADTRQELPPIHHSALTILEAVGALGFKTRIVEPALDERFFVYMFGRGVPPPSNVFRWCTRLIKGKPMDAAFNDIADADGEKRLVLTGVRQGESAARDSRISFSCTKDGGECGQGWFQNTGAKGVADVLAPLLHWRVCHVQDWLGFEMSELPTREVMRVYGYDDDEAAYAVTNLRTGCYGCPLVAEDRALERVISLEGWGHLAPLRRLRPLYAQLKEPHNRLRKVGERKKDGTLAAKQGRLGPLTMEARRYALGEVLGIQDEINGAAKCEGRPEVSLINDEEHARILELIAANTFPNKWDGDEPAGDLPYVQTGRDGSTQPLLLAE